MAISTQDPKSMVQNTLNNTLPIMEKSQVAFYLALIAGLMNGYTYHVANLFSTVQSGNIILLGQTIATKNWDHFYSILLTVLAFGIGSMLTACIEQLTRNSRNRSWTFIVIFLEIIILIILASGIFKDQLSIAMVCIIISFIAGMQGNAFHKIKGMLYGNIAVTLVVQLAFSYLMHAIQGGKGALQTALLFFGVLFGFGFGGFGGTLLAIQYSELSLLLPAFLLILLMIYLFFAKLEIDAPIDPDA